MADGWQLTQGGSKELVSINSRGSGIVRVTSHRQEAQIGLIWERGKDFSS